MMCVYAVCVYLRRARVSKSWEGCMYDRWKESDAGSLFVYSGHL